MKEKEEVIGCRFPTGTRKRIKKVQDKIYFGRSVVDFVKENVITALEREEAVMQNTIMYKKQRGKNG